MLLQRAAEAQGFGVQIDKFKHDKVSDWNHLTSWGVDPLRPSAFFLMSVINF